MEAFNFTVLKKFTVKRYILPIFDGPVSVLYFDFSGTLMHSFSFPSAGTHGNESDTVTITVPAHGIYTRRTNITTCYFHVQVVSLTDMHI